MPSDTAIKVENLSKRYRIGTRKQGYKTFREAIIDTAKVPLRLAKVLTKASTYISSSTDDTIWALNNVSFEIKRGEVVGIIGRNGAGKSTLLKILAKITEPTTGNVVIKGRIGSLLEIGTGFHPELTGHENIYLYGAILGMDRFEVTRKFDEIVAFAEMEKFIDTPVKRYSSGMYMRLAFAVAAHLETEILLVDEVLAVGDASFQKKCIGKMDSISDQGRTVLFVSHNLNAIKKLCEKAILLDSGALQKYGDTENVIDVYKQHNNSLQCEVAWQEANAPGTEDFKLYALKVYNRNKENQTSVSSNQDILVEITFTTHIRHESLCVGFDLLSRDGAVLARSYQTDQPLAEWPSVKQGTNTWKCCIPAGLLNAGVYDIAPRVGLHNINWLVHIEPVVRFEVVLEHGTSPLWNVLDGSNRPGTIAPIFRWSD